jgi:hypothetical protein
VDVLGRIEEAMPPNGPTFWNLIGEVYPQMVDALFESSLITGVVQASNQRFTITANTTYFKNPKGFIAPLRLKAPYAIRKTSLRGLDSTIPNWQQATPGYQIQAWFPLGCSGFGVYPQMASEQTVIMDWIQSPVNEARPYTGNETVPLQTEFSDLISMYAAAGLRSKEGGQEAEESATVFSEYLSTVKSLSLFQGRLDSLVFSAAYGAKSQVNPRSIV